MEEGFRGNEENNPRRGKRREDHPVAPARKEILDQGPRAVRQKDRRPGGKGTVAEPGEKLLPFQGNRGRPSAGQSTLGTECFVGRGLSVEERGRRGGEEKDFRRWEKIRRLGHGGKKDGSLRAS